MSDALRKSVRRPASFSRGCVTGCVIPCKPCRNRSIPSVREPRPFFVIAIFFGILRASYRAICPQSAPVAAQRSAGSGALRTRRSTRGDDADPAVSTCPHQHAAFRGCDPGTPSGRCCQPSQAEVRTAGRKRARLSELDSHLHCSIIGTCLSSGELRKLVPKFTDLDRYHASDLEIHHAAVELAIQGGAAAKALHKALDERYAGAIRRFDAARVLGADDASAREHRSAAVGVRRTAHAVASGRCGESRGYSSSRRAGAGKRRAEREGRAPAGASARTEHGARHVREAVERAGAATRPQVRSGHRAARSRSSATRRKSRGRRAASCAAHEPPRSRGAARAKWKKNTRAPCSTSSARRRRY